ncbi:MAG: OmpA family protein [Pseudobdellovibrio sp.]
MKIYKKLVFPVLLSIPLTFSKVWASDSNYNLKSLELSAREITGENFSGTNTSPFLAWMPYFQINQKWILNLSVGYSPISSESGVFASWRGLVGAKYSGWSDTWSPEIQIGQENWFRTNTYSSLTYEFNLHYRNNSFERPLFSQLKLDSIFAGYSGLRMDNKDYRQAVLGLRFVFGSDSSSAKTMQENISQSVTTTKPSQAPAEPAQEKVLAEVYFEQSKWNLSEEFAKSLSVIAVKLKSAPDTKIKIQGYTNFYGTEAQNKRISQLRAETVRVYLAHQGVAKNRMTVVAYGSTRPSVAGKSHEAQKMNRRVQVIATE